MPSAMLWCNRSPVRTSHEDAYGREAVYVNVYDMFWGNDYLWPLGLGVYHSGVELYGHEYAFGGHPFPFSGIFEIDPRDASDLGSNFRFKQSIMIGHTDYGEEEVSRLVIELGKDFKGNTYHLLRKNCNTFSGVFAQILCGRSIPGWVNRLAYISATVPMVENSMPREWLTPTEPLNHPGGESFNHDMDTSA